MNKKVKIMVLSALVSVSILIVLTIVGYLYLIGEHIVSIKTDSLNTEIISELYDLCIADDDILIKWERHSFRDDFSFYALYVQPHDINRFKDINNKTIQQFTISNSNNIKKRETIFPYIFFNNGNIIIVTTDLRNQNIDDKYMNYKIYSDRIADFFDDIYVVL